MSYTLEFPIPKTTEKQKIEKCPILRWFEQLRGPKREYIEMARNSILPTELIRITEERDRTNATFYGRLKKQAFKLRRILQSILSPILEEEPTLLETQESAITHQSKGNGLDLEKCEKLEKKQSHPQMEMRVKRSDPIPCKGRGVYDPFSRYSY